MTAPQRFQSVRNKSDCGTVVLWSRGTETETKRGNPALSLAALEALILAHTIYSADEVDVRAAPSSGPRLASYALAQPVQGAVGCRRGRVFGAD